MIGERLEEARKRKGVTIREAAEATKIRGDFLASMEDNQFDLGLPNIYVRGFLKNYARFLKIDANRLLTDFDAFQLGRNPAATAGRPQREALGHMDFNKPAGREEAPEKSHRSASEAATAGQPTSHAIVTEAPEDDRPEPVIKVNLPRRSTELKAPPSAESMRENARNKGGDEDNWEEQRDLFIKVGVSITGAAIVILLAVVLFRAITGGGDDVPELNPELTGTAPVTTAPALSEPAQATGPETLTVYASDNVTIIIEQTMDRSRLFSGTMNAGDVISVEKEGPVSIRFTNGSAITIEKDGQQMLLQQEGFGRTVVD